jgi:hypothetical protein
MTSYFKSSGRKFLTKPITPKADNMHSDASLGTVTTSGGENMCHQTVAKQAVATRTSARRIQPFIFWAAAGVILFGDELSAVISEAIPFSVAPIPISTAAIEAIRLVGSIIALGLSGWTLLIALSELKKSLNGGGHDR